DHPTLRCTFAHIGQQGGMAAMQAIERADREHAAVRGQALPRDVTVDLEHRKSILEQALVKSWATEGRSGVPNYRYFHSRIATRQSRIRDDRNQSPHNPLHRRAPEGR